MVEDSSEFGLEVKCAEYRIDGHIGAFEDGRESCAAFGRVVRVGMLAVNAEETTYLTVNLCSPCLSKFEVILTFGHEFRVLQCRFHLFVQGKALHIHYRAILRKIANSGGAEQVVGQCDAVAGCDFTDLVLTVAVESSPLNRISPRLTRAPVKGGLLVSMANDQLAAFVVAWERDNERSELGFGAGSIDMGFEEAGGSRVYLDENG